MADDCMMSLEEVRSMTKEKIGGTGMAQDNGSIISMPKGSDPNCGKSKAIQNSLMDNKSNG